jgi:glycosyltransferase involved in cell wall biosynthesis
VTLVSKPAWNMGNVDKIGGDDHRRGMISIIIPTLNEAKIIESTLRTLAATLTRPHEVIVSDGGSSDRTAELAARYADTVVVFSGIGRQTIGEGRNDGAKVAVGDFLVFLDADCVIPEPDRFFAQALTHFEKHPGLVGLTAYLRVFPADETLGDKLVAGIANLGLRVANNLLKRGASMGEFQMIRREAFARVGGFRADLIAFEDTDMFRRLSRIGRTMIAPKLRVLHSGRRGHQVGYPQLLATWLVNMVSLAVRDRTFSKEWKPIR